MNYEDRLKSDFRAFLWLIWNHLGLPTPTPVQYDIARYLQHGPPRMIVEAFRGVGKSWITSAFLLWLWYRDPDVKIMAVSASKTRADDLSNFCLRLIKEVPELNHLAPSRDQRDSRIMFDVGPSKTSKDPSMKSVGITGQLTGSRADIILADDIEVPSNSATQQQRDKIAELVKEFDAVLKPNGRVIYLGTPQTEQSLYLTLATRGYSVRIWPILYPEPTKLVGNYGDWIAPFITQPLEEKKVSPGDSVVPTRFPLSDIDNRRLSYGRAGFSLQFMLDTALSDADRYPLKLRDLVVTSLDPEKAPMSLVWGDTRESRISDLPQVGLNGDRWLGPVYVDREYSPYTGKVCFVDPSGRGRDETAWAIVAVLHGWYYLLKVGGSRRGYDDSTLLAIANDCKNFKVPLVLCEPNMGDGMFTNILRAKLREVYPTTCQDAERASGQKELRIIETLEPVMASHRLVVDRRVVEQDLALSYEDLGTDEVFHYRLTHQLTRVTRDRGALKQDDRLDAVAGAIAHFVSAAGVDQKTQIEDAKAEALESELTRFKEAFKDGPRDSMNALSWCIDP